MVCVSDDTSWETQFYPLFLFDMFCLVEPAFPQDQF